jgi:type IV pilus assembly protein PilV
MKANATLRRGESGTTMLEVLVAIVIVVVGLLGLAGLQSRASASEMESFQRAQALMLLQDMVDRLGNNRKQVASYQTTVPLGTGQSDMDCSKLTGKDLDVCEWNNSLLGAAEVSGTSKVGAMIGARGCIDVINNAMPRQVRVSVVWQGLAPLVSPGATACGKGQYDSSDLTRRAVTTVVTIGCLQNNPVTLQCVTP